MTVEEFIARWTNREGGAERANYVMFLTELCEVIGVDKPEPAGASREYNDYVFERAVRKRDSADKTTMQRIDLYKKGCFILEAKQSRLPGKTKAPRLDILGQSALDLDEPEHLGRRSAAKGWDAMMQSARRQGEDYVFLLETSQPSPPFLIVCDVGHCFEIFADFSGTGRAYGQFPDRKGFRIFLDDLRDQKVRDRLKAIWTEPSSLDPTKHAAVVTRDIAKRLADVSKRLEKKDCNAEDVAHFLMRCLFTMFAEDVELLPKASFQNLLKESIDDPSHFAFRLKSLWQQMDEGEHYSFVIKDRVRKFNGGLFKNTTAFDLDREEIGELAAAAGHDWKSVDPAIFGTLLEQALDPKERRKLGAHYTPRAYVQRLVDVTIMEPLREDWRKALTKAETAKADGDEKKAVAIVRAFHHQLCATRVLDPACGTGNFLYVSLELMKKLEGEVLETLAKLGEPESMGFDREEVDPHQFLGLEINPRAAAIAELVIWLGYLQQHYRTRTGHPSEPVLKDFKNVNFGLRGGYDAVLTWDGYPVPTVIEKGGKRMEWYPNARRPVWPEAEFIVGNPPFIGGKDIRSRLPPGYAESLWSAHTHINESADFVMYWWDRAAELLTRTNSPLARFGLVTTNSISQVFQRRVVELHLEAKVPISLIFAVPDHPWTKTTKDSAAVRIGMTVAAAGSKDGRLARVTREEALDTDSPITPIELQSGRINSDLSIGVDVNKAATLLSNEGLGGRGVQLIGDGFIVSKSELEIVGFSRREGIGKYVRPYLNGRDVAARSRGVFAIDFFGKEKDFVQTHYPEAYHWLLERVQPERARNNRGSYRRRWWQFGENVNAVRESIADIERYIALVRTARHRAFLFLQRDTIPDAKLIVISSADAWLLAILSSRHHVIWALATGGWLGIGNDHTYNHTECFAKFAFPDTSDFLKRELSTGGEKIDAHRKRVLATHPDLTLTGLYNILEKLKTGTPLTNKEEDIKQRGLVLILKELHEEIDRLTADAYGWPHDLSDDEILARLVALNAERMKEEAAGHVRWLRPDYQIPRFGKKAAAKTGELELPETVVAIDAGLPAFPADAGEATLAVEAMLASSGKPATAAEIARGFKRGGKRIEQKVLKALGTLALYGRVSSEGDAFVVRRAA